MDIQQIIDQDQFPNMNTDMLAVKTIGRGMIRNEAEAFLLAPFVADLKQEYFHTFEEFPDGETRASYEDLDIQTVRHQSNLTFQLYDEGHLRMELEEASAITIRASEISPEIPHVSGTKLGSDKGMCIMEILLVATCDGRPNDGPADLHQPELQTYMTHRGRLFHSNISWEEDDNLDDEPELDGTYTIRSRTLLPTREMPSEEELLDLMMATYTIMGLRLMGELTGHHPLAASWRPEEEDENLGD